ncbi:hypothetical protein [Mastigocoleus testarum]|uniref:Uncharacterized protein n=1 Tax=Mastigocoleus testarum BC008 TaxID=371196 RepID=A0A0V7ZLR2_9CYAN|nr:hypothetical protein [Mastigocoleus testarum]KST65425.1 hypothetical protein BC008_41560 [Mastigocoleus testarum BC008]
MFDEDNSLNDRDAFCKNLNEILGMNLADDITTKLLDGEDLSVNELIKHHSLSDIGNALIRLNDWCPRRCQHDSTNCKCILGCCFQPNKLPPAPRKQETDDILP